MLVSATSYSLEIMWMPPWNDGGYPVIEHSFQYTYEGSVLQATASTDGTTGTLAHLDSDTEYLNIAVAGVNKLGRGTWSGTFTAKTEPFFPVAGDGWYFQIKSRNRRAYCLGWLVVAEKLRMIPCDRADWAQLWQLSSDKLIVNALNGRYVCPLQHRHQSTHITVARMPSAFPRC